MTQRGTMIAEALRSAASLRSPESRLQAVIGLVIETGPWTSGSICTPGPGGQLCTEAYLDIRAREGDRLQAETGQGPAFDALGSEPVQVVGDLHADRRWPNWSPRAIDLGFTGAMSLRLFTDVTVGTVNVYSSRPIELSGASIQAASIQAALDVAAHASIVVDAMMMERNLRRAMDSRNLIGQAQGILMQRHDLTADAAFALLRRISQQHNVKIAVLAEHLVSAGELPS